MILFAVFIGGAVGSAARYTVSRSIQDRFAGSFPCGTLAVNVLGSFLLGAALPILGTSAVPATLQAFLTVGLFGAFTTFSTFAHEAFALAAAGQGGRGVILYVTASLLLGVAAFAAGAFIVGAALGLPMMVG
ncbi:MAG: fluoride efflux transporter CrcB [Gemmatimonadota bacterium]